MRLLLLGGCSFKVNENGEHYFTGGVEKVNDSILKTLCNIYDIYYLYVKENDTIGLENEYKKTYPNLKDVGIIPRTNKKLIDYIDDNEIDMVLVSSWMCPTVVRCIKEVLSFHGVKTIIFSHGPNVCHVKRYCENLIDKNYVYIISPTEHEHRLCLEYKIPEERILKVYNPIDIDDSFITFPPSNGKFVVNSRIFRGKGIDNVLRLCEAINKDVDVIGKIQEEAEYKRLNRDFNNFNSLGSFSREDLFKRLSEYEFCVLLPNQPEGMNLSVIEANALGVPVIVWNNSASLFNGYLDNELNIFLDKDNYIEQFKEKYLPIIDKYLNPENRKELSRRTFGKYGMSVFKENMIRTIDEIYKK